MTAFATSANPRPLTAIEVALLGAQYADHHNAFDHEGRIVALAGGDDPVALGLSPGDTYSTLVFNYRTGAWEWNHENVYQPDRQPDSDWKGDYYEQVICTRNVYA